MKCRNSIGSKRTIKVNYNTDFKWHFSFSVLLLFCQSSFTLELLCPDILVCLSIHRGGQNSIMALSGSSFRTFWILVLAWLTSFNTNKPGLGFGSIGLLFLWLPTPYLSIPFLLDCIWNTALCKSVSVCYQIIWF